VRLVAGVIGHVDHGKTALVRALTGMETDRLEEERRRGISIALGFAHLTVAGGVIDFIDMPGHERFVRTMVAGATGLDAVLLVVAANEGIRPQTREHLDIAALLGVRRAVVAVSKAELVTAEIAAACGVAARALAAGLGLAVAAVVPCSAVTGCGMATLAEALAGMARDGVARAEDGFAYLPLDRVFTLPGHGTVATGTLRRGALAVSDDMELAPAGRRVRLRGVQVHGARVTGAQPGQRVAVNLRDVAAGEVPRGAALVAPGVLGRSAWLSVALRVVAGAPALANGARLMLLAGTEEVAVRLRLLEGDEAAPGAVVMAQLQAARPVSVPARERFILRRASPPLTLGGGQVIDPEAVRLRRGVPALAARLRALAACGPAGIVALSVEAAGAQGVTVTRLARLAGVSPARAVALAEPAVMGRHGLVVAQAAFARVREAVLRVLAEAADGLPPAELAARVEGAGVAVVAEAVARLVQAGTLRRLGGVVGLARPARDADRAAQEAAAARVLAEAMRRGGLSPPEPETVAPGPVTRRLVAQLVRAGVLVRAPDPAQHREILFHQEAVAEARRVLAPLLAPPGLLVREAGAALGVSRKYSVPLLEYFDAVKFTRRVADRRVLARPD
jgi:selenocysteine-specific elongation factor